MEFEKLMYNPPLILNVYKTILVDPIRNIELEVYYSRICLESFGEF